MEQITNCFSRKPFTFMEEEFLAKVYMPNTNIEVDSKGNRFCICVHLCDLFLTYPVTDCGVRCIPNNARCKFGGKCHGCRTLKNGQPTRLKKANLPYKYLFKSRLFNVRCLER